MSKMASQIASLMIVYSAVYSSTDQRKHQSSASLAFVRGIHRWPVNSPHEGPVTRKIFPFDDIIMTPGLWCALLWLGFNNSSSCVLDVYLTTYGRVHWNRNVFILTKFSTLAALEIAKMKTSTATSNEYFVMMTFSFQCCFFWNWRNTMASMSSNHKGQNSL